MDDDHVDDIYDYFKESETDDLNDAMEELGDDYSEDEIRLVRLKFPSEMANWFVTVLLGHIQLSPKLHGHAGLEIIVSAPSIGYLKRNAHFIEAYHTLWVKSTNSVRKWLMHTFNVEKNSKFARNKFLKSQYVIICCR